MRNCLHLAVKKEWEMVLKSLIKETGTKLLNLPDDEDRTPLHYAAVTTNVKVNTKAWFILVKQAQT